MRKHQLILLQAIDCILYSFLYLNSHLFLSFHASLVGYHCFFCSPNDCQWGPTPHIRQGRKYLFMLNNPQTPKMLYLLSTNSHHNPSPNLPAAYVTPSFCISHCLFFSRQCFLFFHSPLSTSLSWLSSRPLTRCAQQCLHLWPNQTSQQSWFAVTRHY